MNSSAKEGSDCQHNGRRHEDEPHGGPDATDPAIPDNEVINGLLEDMQPGLIFQGIADGPAIQHPVGLGTRCPYRRPLAGIQHTEMDPGQISCTRHASTQGIDFPDQMTLADTPDGRVTAHLPEGVEIVGQQQSTRAKSCRGQGGLGTGMAATNHDDLELSF